MEQKQTAQMNPEKTVCPVDYVKQSPGFDVNNMLPLTGFIGENRSLPDADLQLPVGTVTNDGRLDLCKQQLGVEGMQHIAAGMKQNKVIRHILLGTNAFGNEGAKAVAEMIRENNNLETLYLGCNYIEAEGCKAICEALEDNQSIKSLWFKRNPIGIDSVAPLIALLRKNDNIRTLDLVNTCLGNGFIELFYYLLNNRTIERLYLSGNYLTPDKIKLFDLLLKHNTTLKALFLSVNNIGDDGVANIVNGLKQNNTLEELSLASCGIGDDGMLQLFDALQHNRSLKSLDLGYAPSTRVLGSTANYISSVSEKELIHYVMKAEQLELLNLTRTGISDAARAILIREWEPGGKRVLIADGYQSVNRYTPHPDSKAIKSVYR